MQNFILNELRELCTRIRHYPSDKSIGGGKIADTILKLVEYSIQVKKEGRLAMEESLILEDLSDNITSYMVEILNLVLDGVEPQLVEKLGLYRYLSDGDENPFDALCKLITLTAARSIQEGENPRMTENQLILMVPPEIRLLCVRKFDEIVSGNKQKNYQDLVNVHFEEKTVQNDGKFPENSENLNICDFFEPVINDLTDKELQKLLRETQNPDLRTALSGLSRKTAQRILHNMPENRGRMLMEEMEHLEKVSFLEASESRKTLLNLIYDLYQTGEIFPDRPECASFHAFADYCRDTRSVE